MPLAPPPPPPPAWLTSGGKQAGEEGSSPAGASRATTWAKQVRPYAYETADPASDGSVPIVLSGVAGDGWSWCDRRLLRRRAARHGDFFFNDAATTETYTLSLHDALPI